MQPTKVDTAKALRQLLFFCVTSVPTKEQIKEIDDPKMRDALLASEKKLRGEVYILVKKVAPQLEPPDITNQNNILDFIDRLSETDLGEV